MDAPAAIAWENESGGVTWHVELDRAVLLPGRLVSGRLALLARDPVEARQLVAALVGEEHWRHEETTRNANGTTSTQTVTSRDELRRVPEQLHGPLQLAAGQRWETTFDLPVPPMGPASLDATEAGLEWRFEAKLDIDNGFDSTTERPVVIAQPTALLRAGAVHVGEFALYESADVAADGVTGSIELEPMPLVTGESFAGRIRLQVGDRLQLQEIRAELRVLVEATVSSGRDETITAWSAVLAPAAEYLGELDLPFTGELAPRPLSTVELPHGRAQATFHVILARAWSLDTHLVRDVTIATTREL
jgi:arrestin (S-antigen)-like protein